MYLAGAVIINRAEECHRLAKRHAPASNSTDIQPVIQSKAPLKMATHSSFEVFCRTNFKNSGRLIVPSPDTSIRRNTCSLGVDERHTCDVRNSTPAAVPPYTPHTTHHTPHHTPSRHSHATGLKTEPLLAPHAFPSLLPAPPFPSITSGFLLLPSLAHAASGCVASTSCPARFAAQRQLTRCDAETVAWTSVAASVLPQPDG